MSDSTSSVPTVVSEAEWEPRADNRGVQLERVEFPVTLSDQQAYTVVGYLYMLDDNRKGDKRKSHTVQVLLHGGTYNHRYWDAGTINGVDYSYARFMVARGYAVLALDRLGAGESSKPDGDFLDKDENAASLAQVLASLRQPKNPTPRHFKRIVLVGHSLARLSPVERVADRIFAEKSFKTIGYNTFPGHFCIHKL